MRLIEGDAEGEAEGGTEEVRTGLAEDLRDMVPVPLPMPLLPLGDEENGALRLEEGDGSGDLEPETEERGECEGEIEGVGEKEGAAVREGKEERLASEPLKLGGALAQDEAEPDPVPD